ncbi:MPN domain-containing protein-like [Penaeus indicus]|uniref:MPN domain-containing protein-like n=1 Tax=Penaeus indicus TaxID=29960 RepID=UPI00300C41B6
MSVEPSTHEEIQIDDEVEEIDEEEEEEDEVDEDEEVDEEEEEEEVEEVTHGRSTGRGLTLKTLVKERVLQPGEGLMTINYLGNKFKGDLLPDGRIKSQETSKIFGTPSAWAIYCKKIVNPDKKSGCGWASVRYRGKKLDSYKNNWYRQKRIEFEKEGEALDEEEMTDSDSDGPHEQEIVEFELIGNRHPNHDMNTMVELTSFQSIGRMQPFTVTMSSSAMAMIDIHAHLTTSEVVGYLAGQWDVTNHNLIVSHAMPVRCRLGDGEKGRAVEQALYAEMEKLNLSLVGWYHTHPFSPPLPSLRDIDSQLEYEMKMKGSNDASYTPCIGIIVSPYVRGGGQGMSASGFWVMPPPEHKPQEYGRPMSIQFTIVQDAFIPKEALYHVRDTVRFYKDSPDSVIFTDIFQDRFTYWDKLKTAIRLCVPKDHYAPLLDCLAKLLELKNYVPEPATPGPKPKPASEPDPEASAEVIPVESQQTPSNSVSITPVDKPRTSPEVVNSIRVVDPDVLMEPPKTASPPSVQVPETVHPDVVSAMETPASTEVVDVSVEKERLLNQEQRHSPPEPKQLTDYEHHHPYHRHSPPPYKPPSQEHLNQERKQDQQPEYIEDPVYEQYQHSQQMKEYQYDKKHEYMHDMQEDYREEMIDEFRPPPPNYHQHHFTVSSSYEPPPPLNDHYKHDEPKILHTPEDRVLESQSEESHLPAHYPENLARDPWASQSHLDVPQQVSVGENKPMQPMDVDSLS